MSLSFREKAARIIARKSVEHHLERTRRIVAILGATALGIGLGLALAENRNPWVICSLVAYCLAMMVETVLMHRQFKRSITDFEQLMANDTEA